MTDTTGQAAAAAPATGAPAAGSTPWHGNDYASLVTTKGWKSPDDALKSYAELEKFRGAPADRLLVLPDKPDAPEWADVRKRVGWAAPEKPEDYGIKPAEGFPEDYAKAIATAAHKAGIPKSALEALVSANDEFIKSQGAAAQAQEADTIKARLADADKAITERFGAKAAQMQEAMVREAQRLGITPEEMTEIEATLALTGEGKALGKFRAMLADIAQARTEGTFHQAGQQSGGGAAEAKTKLSTLTSNPEWVKKSMTRGTPEAIERMMLNAAASGVAMDRQTAERLASGTLGA